MRLINMLKFLIKLIRVRRLLHKNKSFFNTSYPENSGKKYWYSEG